MKFKITRDWLKKRAARDENAVVTTGHSSLDDLIHKANTLRQTPADQERLVSAFGKLVRCSRIEQQLSIEMFAKRSDIDEKELERIEKDSHFVPEPRTVHQLAKVLHLPVKSLLQLSGHMVVTNSRFFDYAERFAACAGNVERLNKEQYETLKVFVKYLAQQP